MYVCAMTDSYVCCDSFLITCDMPASQTLRHVTMSHGTHVNESWHTREWVMAHTWISHGTHIHVTCLLVRLYGMSRWVMAHTWMSHGTDIHVSWHTCECVMSQKWMSHGTHKHESLYFPTWKMVRAVGCRAGKCDMSHMNEWWNTHEWVMAHARMSQVTHMNETY